jgi:hypothetical protein
MDATIDSPRQSKWSIVVMFSGVALFGLLGLLIVFAMYDNMIVRELRGPELIIPLLLGMGFISMVSFLLIWQLARMISSHQKSSQNTVVERHFIRDVPPQPQLGVPNDQIVNPVEYPSVIEHTTRQFAGVRREPDPSK